MRQADKNVRAPMSSRFQVARRGPAAVEIRIAREENGSALILIVLLIIIFPGRFSEGLR